MTRLRRLTIVGITLLLAAVGAACGASSPVQSDVLPEASLAFPGATLSQRQWGSEETGTGIDGNDLTNEAGLDLEYRLATPVAACDVYGWYDTRLRAEGWSKRGPAGQTVLYNKKVGNRLHRINVGAGDFDGQSTTSTIQISYNIGLEGGSFRDFGGEDRPGPVSCHAQD